MYLATPFSLGHDAMHALLHEFNGRLNRLPLQSSIRNLRPNLLWKSHIFVQSHHHRTVTALNGHGPERLQEPGEGAVT